MTAHDPRPGRSGHRGNRVTGRAPRDPGRVRAQDAREVSTCRIDAMTRGAWSLR